LRIKGFPSIVAPQISPFSFGDEPLNRGEVASVNCVVPKGDLPLDIYWTLNSALIVLEYKLIEVEKSKGSAFALLCQAQAFPVPLIR